MPLHLAARLHAFVHGLFKPSEAQVVQRVYAAAERRFTELGIESDMGRTMLVQAIGNAASNHLGLPPGHAQNGVATQLTSALVSCERLFVLPPQANDTRTIAQWWDIHSELDRQLALVADLDATCNHLADTVAQILHPILAACPALVEPQDSDGLHIKTELLRCLPNVGVVTEAMLAAAGEAATILPRLSEQLERNVIAASGGNPADPKGFTRAPKLPSQNDAREPETLVSAYLAGTPLYELFDQHVDFTIHTSSRFEHHHIVAGSGHGKTQTLQYLIAHDLEAVSKGERSIVVLDSQGDLIKNIANLAVFAEGEPLHDRLVLIDPSDVEWPVSLNLFDVGMERLFRYAPLERERLTNSILELYDFVLGTLLSAEMTQKQSVIFRYVTRLMLHIPDATIHTLRELMEPGSEKTFAPHIAKLSGTARHFFETEFAGKEFEQTKKQVLRRLWGILENQTFERMFSHPRSKLDLFAEMNAGKVILINTAKDLLKEQGTEIFGRFFIALIAQAAQERATLPEYKRTRTIVYVDEAQDYFDRNMGLILAQARKYNVGMVLSHQYLGQLDPKLQEAFGANTAIKFAGGVSAKDARTLAPMLYCTPELIEAQGKGSFAVHVRGQTKGAVPLAFPFGYMEAMATMTAQERSMLRETMRQRYAVHFSQVEHGGQAEVAKEADTPAAEPIEPKERKPPPGQVDTTPGEAW